MDLWQDFHGPNAGYVLELYDRFVQDPQSVDAATRALFAQWQPPTAPPPAQPAPPADSDKVMGVVNLAQAIRDYGHLAAQLDPLGSAPPGDPALELAMYGLSEADLQQLPASLIHGPLALRSATAAQAIQELRTVYSNHIGYDYDHLRSPEERAWLRHAAESYRFRPAMPPPEARALLERLTEVEAFELFLHRAFPGKTRFSIEGLDMLVPILDEILWGAADRGICTALIGMAHRGRLNVLAHVLNKPVSQILAEFKDPVHGQDFTIREDLGWTGDVKYHKGAQRALRDGEPIRLIAEMAPNPSHLEFVNPLVEGMARAAGSGVDRRGAPVFYPDASLPILIHGDAAFPGQGIVAETLNLARLDGYTTGGTIHIIANNQIGFTATRSEVVGTLYVSDLAKGFKIPVVHVNADDPLACLEVTRLALAYRQEFRRDFLIDLVGYRRHGHNEGDEPGFTQPLMARTIDTHPSVRTQWAATLVQAGTVDADWPTAQLQDQLDALQRELEGLKPEEQIPDEAPKPPPPGAARHVQTAVPAAQLRALNADLLHVPADFTVHPKLVRVLERRLKAFEPDNDDEVSVDWAAAEALALASILADGTPIRLTGEDVERGTFGHRHAVLHDAANGQRYVPLQVLPQVRAAFEIHNSPLTEGALVGFEYGYNVLHPHRCLVIWEAQYGDFVNGAQVIIDEYLTSGRAKFGQTPSLVLLLPHGYEGQGPDHSSARVERFLQAAAETNMRIANATTAAQYFHLLRRQAALLETDPLPLIVLTPKSLLRHPHTASPLRELAEDAWQPVIDDAWAQPQRAQVVRLVLCSGKIYVDLISSPLRTATPAVALVRIEQLYPFPAADLAPVLEAYPNLHEVIWLQEEPENMGAWEYMQPRLRELIAGRWPLVRLSRRRASSPAEGSTTWHIVSQKVLIEEAFDLKPDGIQDTLALVEKI